MHEKDDEKLSPDAVVPRGNPGMTEAIASQ